MQDDEIVQLASRIRSWQEGRGLSDAELCRQYSGLGTTKTYKRILADDLEGLEIEDKWLPEYRAVWSLMEIVDQAGGRDEPDYDDLANVNRARVAAMHAIQERGNNRIVIIEGPPGTGKTTALRCIAAKFGRKVVIIEANALWHDRPGIMLGGLLRALNIADIPASGEDRLLKLLARLKSHPCCLAIDDAHHCGPQNLNILKTIINETRCQILLCGVDTLMRRMAKGAYEEARQINNRLGERVRFEPPRPSDVEKFCARRGVTWSDAKTACTCCKNLAGRAADVNHWNFVNRVVRILKETDGPVDQVAYDQVVKEGVRSFFGTADSSRELRIP